MNFDNQKFLIVIDMQNDFILGPLGTSDAQDIVGNVYNKIREAKKSGTHIIFTRDTHFDNYLDTLEGKLLPVPHCLYNSIGWQIHSALPTNAAKIYDKYTFGDEFLAKLLATYYDLDPTSSSIELCGLCTDVCVISNALLLRAFLPNIRIKVDASCCAGTTPEKHKAALEVMKSCQIEVIE